MPVKIRLSNHKIKSQKIVQGEFSLLLPALSLLLCLILSGCMTSTMNRIMSSWEGSHIDSVIAQWGYPSEMKKFRERELYIWHYEKSYYMPQSSTTTGSIYGSSYYGQTYTSGGYMIHGGCTRILEINKEGYVISWEWNGNNCPLMEVFEYANWRNKNN